MTLGSMKVLEKVSFVPFLLHVLLFCVICCESSNHVIDTCPFLTMLFTFKNQLDGNLESMIKIMIEKLVSPDNQTREDKNVNDLLISPYID